MKRIYRLKHPLRVIQEQARPIRFFPLIGVSLQGFIYAAAILLMMLVVCGLAATPPCPGSCMGSWLCPGPF